MCSNVRICVVLERNFGCKVVGGASRNAIIFRASDATAPFVTRNVELLELLAPQFEEQLRQYKEEDSFIELVRRAIQDRLTGQRPSMDVISEALHMSSRTLQRRLQESGSSFQRVLDEARHQMARYYLSNSVLELNEAAYLLGLKIRTRSVAPFAPGKACRRAIGVRLIALQPSIEANRAICCKERSGIATRSPWSTTPRTWPRDFQALRSRQSRELGFADALVQRLRLSSEAEHPNHDLKCRTSSCAREENGSLEPSEGRRASIVWNAPQ